MYLVKKSNDKYQFTERYKDKYNCELKLPLSLKDLLPLLIELQGYNDELMLKYADEETNNYYKSLA